MRSLYPYYLARGLGALGNEFQLFAVPLLIYRATGSLAWSGLAFFVEWGPRLLSFPLSGVCVDRFGPRRMYVLADAVRFLSASLSVLVAVAFPSGAVPVIMLVGLIGGFSFELAFLSVEKVVQRTVAKSDVHRAQAVLGGIDHAMMLMGPAAAGALATLWSTEAILGAMAILFGCSLFAFVWMTPDQAPSREHSNGVWSDWHEGLKLVSRTSRLRTVVLLTTLINAVVGLSLAIGPAMVARVFDKSDAYLGIVYTASGAAGLAAVTLTPLMVRHLGLARLGVLAFLATCGAFFAASTAPTFSMYVVATAALMAMDGVFTVFIRTERAQLIPEALFGKTLGIVILLNFLPMPAVGLVTASIGDLIGARALAGGGACICLFLSTPLVLRLWYDRQHLPTNEVSPQTNE